MSNRRKKMNSSGPTSVYRKKAGLPPGSLVHIGEKRSEQIRLDLVDYSAEQYREHAYASVDDIMPHIRDESVNTWIRVSGLHDTDQIGKLGELLDIHPLVMEDIVNTRQRTKIESYDEYLFIVLKHLQPESQSGVIESRQVSLIVSKSCVISFHEEQDLVFDAILPRIQVANGRFRRYGSDYLAYALVDLVVDHYFTVLDEVAEETYSLEMDLIDVKIKVGSERLHLLRRRILSILREIGSTGDVVNTMLRTDNKLVSADIRVYLTDVADHFHRVKETLNHLLDVSVTLLDTHMAQNTLYSFEVMKVLTIIATIFIPLTFVVGIYGMNFDPEASPWNMPELQWYYGYPAAMGFMLMMSLGMLLYFRRRKWI